MRFAWLVSLAAAILAATPSAGPPNKYAAALAYSQCMRSHGVPSFPDPKLAAGGGIEISQAGTNQSSPLVISAQQACRTLLPNGGEPTEGGQRRELARMLATARCMRSHGFPQFPDPTLSPPLDRGAYAAIMSNAGVWLAIPAGTDVRSPLFERAEAGCKLT